MFEHIAEFTAWPILTGLFIGYIANRIVSGEGKGCCMNIAIGENPYRLCLREICLCKHASCK